MLKRWTALLLAFAAAFTLACPGTRAENEESRTADAAGLAEARHRDDDDDVDPPEEEEEQEEPEAPLDPTGTLTFENLRARMLRHYYPLRALQESIDDLENRDYDWRYEDLRDNINSLVSYQWMMTTMNPLITETASYQALDTQYRQMRKEFEDIDSGKTQQEDQDTLRQYRNAQEQAVVAGESLYVALLDMMAKDAALTRQIAQLDRTVQELELRYEFGQIPELTLAQARSGRTQAVSGQKTLQMNIEAYLLQLKSMVGADLGEPLSLGVLPTVTEEQLAAMDLEADLARAMEASYELFDAKKQLDDFKKDTYDKVHDSLGSNEKRFEVSQVNHALQALKYNYESTLLNYELNFRTLYAQVRDCAQVLEAKRDALSAQELSYGVSALKFEQGNISANALADAADELATARDAVSDAERELFSHFRSYQWAVEYGILNG
ncbi:MAG: TolC family protein [Ruminococcaceae bacterium]|jgi:outer membrane protein TolC|nr:TolC family protein [Oscillospiraceae bacterium]